MVLHMNRRSDATCNSSTCTRLKKQVAEIQLKIAHEYEKRVSGKRRAQTDRPRKKRAKSKCDYAVLLCINIWNLEKWTATGCTYLMSYPIRIMCVFTFHNALRFITKDHPNFMCNAIGLAIVFQFVRFPHLLLLHSLWLWLSLYLSRYHKHTWNNISAHFSFFGFLVDFAHR